MSDRPGRPVAPAPDHRRWHINTDLLMCDAAGFRIAYVINPYMDPARQPDPPVAIAEHEAIARAHRAAGRNVTCLTSAPDCPDMVFTANAALVAGDRVLLGNPPAARRAELPHFASWFADRGYVVLDSPYAFSGQGDALVCGDVLLAGYGQRTDRRVHPVLADLFGYRVVPLHTVGDRWYDLDLAVAVIDRDTLAYVPAALDDASVRRLHDLGPALVEVGTEEAHEFALNLVSDGTTVTMTTGAPRFAAQLRERGKVVVELDTAQLRKGGGGIRCTALTLDNPLPRGA